MFPWRKELSRERRLFILQRILLILISGRCSWAQAISRTDLHASLVAAERKAYDHGRTFNTYVCLIFTLASDEARRRLEHHQQQQQQQQQEHEQLEEHEVRDGGQSWEILENVRQ